MMSKSCFINCDSNILELIPYVIVVNIYIITLTFGQNSKWVAIQDSSKRHTSNHAGESEFGEWMPKERHR